MRKIITLFAVVLIGFQSFGQMVMSAVGINPANYISPSTKTITSSF